MTIVSCRTLFDWVVYRALPLWSTTGVDKERGGFVERLHPNGNLEADVRRARLVSRQIYAFSTAGRLGWTGPSDELVNHGRAALLTHHIGSDNVAIPRFRPDTRTSENGFDLYDQAFVLFGLSHLAQHAAGASAESIALNILSTMRDGWSHAEGGFGETKPIVPPLKANPHMHLFEAAQAWLDVSTDSAWVDLAQEMADLCIARFINPRTGALQEYFGAQWEPPSDLEQQIIEPGHQSEWAWLLVRWYKRTGHEKYLSAARGLFSVAEDRGTDPSRIRLVNELTADLQPRDRRMRLWPQTERIKSLVLFAELATSPYERELLDLRIEQAVAALLDYTVHPVAGSWWEHLGTDGQPVVEPARASSLYHIMGAVAELSRYTGLRLV